jgi:hypothetical protein
VSVIFASSVQLAGGQVAQLALALSARTIVAGHLDAHRFPDAADASWRRTWTLRRPDRLATRLRPHRNPHPARAASTSPPGQATWAPCEVEAPQPSRATATTGARFARECSHEIAGGADGVEAERPRSTTSRRSTPAARATTSGTSSPRASVQRQTSTRARATARVSEPTSVVEASARSELGAATSLAGSDHARVIGPSRLGRAEARVARVVAPRDVVARSARDERASTRVLRRRGNGGFLRRSRADEQADRLCGRLEL